VRRSHLLCCLLLASIGFSQEDNLTATKVTSPPKIDGVVTDAEWGSLPSGSGFRDSQTGAEAEGGTFWIGYDERYIYFAARMQSSNPKGIKKTEYRSNVNLQGDDAVYLQLDLFDSPPTANTFGINARGATQIRIGGGRAAKREWLGDFLGAGRVTDSGFEVEARIPWGVMRLPDPGNRDIRIQVSRYNSQNQREGEWKYTNSDARQIPFWQGVDVPRSGNARTIKLLPYAYGGFQEDRHIANAGLDLKTSLSDRIDLVGTINPDFRNIENQILSIDFSRFERLAGESRPFFLEGGEFYRTSLDAPVFTSQRIRRFDAGVKTFGQLTDKTDFSLLDTIDLGHQNAFAGIGRHRFNDATNATFALTSLTHDDGPDNVATFASLTHQFNSWSVFGQHSLTRDTAVGNGNRVNFGAFFNRDGWDGVAEYSQVSPQYNPRLGFAPERNFKGLNFSLGKGSTVSRGPIMETGFSANYKTYRTYDSNRHYRNGGELEASFAFRGGLEIDLGAAYEKFFDSHDRAVYFEAEYPRGDVYRQAGIEAVFGNIAGAPYRSLGAGLSYRPLWNWQVNLDVQAVDHFDRETQLILGTVFDIGRDMSISGRLVRDGNDTNAYIAFRKSGERGAEYFLILGDPNARRFQTALVLKAVFPFEIKF